MLSMFYYRLHSIAARGKSAPVIIVGTHKDDPTVTSEYLNNVQDELNSKFKRKFKALRNILFVSCSNGDVCLSLSSSLSLSLPFLSSHSLPFFSSLSLSFFLSLSFSLSLSSFLFLSFSLFLSLSL